MERKRQEADVNVTVNFYQALLKACRIGEALVCMRGTVSDNLRARAMARDGAVEDQKKALAEQYLEDMGRLADFYVDVLKVEGSDLGSYWFVKRA